VRSAPSTNPEPTPRLTKDIEAPPRVPPELGTAARDGPPDGHVRTSSAEGGRRGGPASLGGGPGAAPAQADRAVAISVAVLVAVAEDNALVTSRDGRAEGIWGRARCRPASGDQGGGKRSTSARETIPADQRVPSVPHTVGTGGIVVTMPPVLLCPRAVFCEERLRPRCRSNQPFRHDLGEAAAVFSACPRMPWAGHHHGRAACCPLPAARTYCARIALFVLQDTPGVSVLRAREMDTPGGNSFSSSRGECAVFFADVLETEGLGNRSYWPEAPGGPWSSTRRVTSTA
jgi:hypothetical protein